MDDDPDARFIFTIALESAGYEVAIARDGAEAVRLTRILSPEVVVMDIMMPRMDGIGALHGIRSVSGERRIPIIAVTALVTPGDQTFIGKHADFDEILFKPILPMQVVEAVARYARPTWSGAYQHGS